MSKTIINPDSLAPPRGFNHGLLVSGGRLLFLAGQDASDAEGKIVAPGDVVAQYEQVVRNLRAVVEAAGGGLQDIVKVNIFVRDRDDYRAHLKEIGAVHRAYFGSYYPTMALFEVSRFFQDEALIEIEGMAVIEESQILQEAAQAEEEAMIVSEDTVLAREGGPSIPVVEVE